MTQSNLRTPVAIFDPGQNFVSSRSTALAELHSSSILSNPELTSEDLISNNRLYKIHHRKKKTSPSYGGVKKNFGKLGSLIYPSVDKKVSLKVTNNDGDYQTAAQTKLIVDASHDYNDDEDVYNYCYAGNSDHFIRAIYNVHDFDADVPCYIGGMSAMMANNMHLARPLIKRSW